MADDTKPPIIVDFGIDQASSLVGAAYTHYTTFANQAYAIAQQAIGQLGTYTVQPIRFNATFDPAIALSQFPTLNPPIAPDLTFHTPTDPGAPPTPTTQAFQIDAAPTDNTVAPVYAPPPKPQLIALSDPGNAPVLTDPTMPTAPVITYPTAPTDIAITLPLPPNIQLPTFQGQRPVFDAPIPDENFTFTPTEYVDALLDKVKAQVSTMLDGGTGLPAAVAKALRDRATNAQDEDTTRQIEESFEEFSARGFEEPNGPLANRLARVRKDAASLRAGVNRDIYVQDQQVAIENLRFAVQQGVALEGTLIQAHNDFMRISLEAARYAVDVAISILNARISVFNAEVQAYQVDAQVFVDLIRAAEVQLEIYRSELEAERLKVDINRANVDKYTAQLQAVNIMVSVYRSQLDAVTAQIQMNSQKLDQYRTRVQVLSEQVQAQTTQIQGYTAQVQAETAKAQFYDTAVRGFATRVQAWSEQQRTKIESARLGQQYDQLLQDAWKAKLALYTAQLQTQLDQLDAKVKGFSAQSDVYKATAQVASAAAEANNRAFQLNLAQQQAIVDTELKRSELDLDQLKFISQQYVEIKKGIAQVSAQLASASMSAVNFSAGTSFAGGARHDYNLSLNYSGSMDDGSVP